MTIMNVGLHPNGGVMVSDTIGTSYDESNSPVAFMQKVWTVVHLGMMMSARNWVLPVQTFNNLLVNGTLVPPTVEDAAVEAEAVFRRVAQEWSDFNGKEAPEAVCYILAWSPEQDRIVGYEFSSLSDYAAQPLADGLRLNPPLQPGTELPVGWQAIALEQQRQDFLLEASERDNIGGWVTVHELMRPRDGEGPSVLSRQLMVLPKFEEFAAQCRAEEDLRRRSLGLAPRLRVVAAGS